MGYSQTQNAYRCLDLTTNRTYLSQYVLFDETQSPLQPNSDAPVHRTSLLSAPPILMLSLPQPPLVLMECAPIFTSSQDISPDLSFSSCPNSHTNTSAQHEAPLIAQLENTSLSNPSPESSPAPIPSQSPNPSQELSHVPIQHPSIQEPRRTHSMTTRSINNIYKPKQVHTVTKHPLPSTIEPSCVSQAISNPKWRTTMSEELTALMRHDTWDLVPPLPNYKPMDSKWVFGVKRKADGSVDHFKARLISKGYNQWPGLDYK